MFSILGLNRTRGEFGKNRVRRAELTQRRHQACGIADDCHDTVPNRLTLASFC
jgi:hypothetical protein